MTDATKNPPFICTSGDPTKDSTHWLVNPQVEGKNSLVASPAVVIGWNETLQTVVSPWLASPDLYSALLSLLLQ